MLLVATVVRLFAGAEIDPETEARLIETISNRVDAIAALAQIGGTIYASWRAWEADEPLCVTRLNAP